jgi:hypothetical protein
MGSSPFRMPSPAVVVFTVLAIGAAVLIATTIASLREVHPSTWAAIALAFAWGADQHDRHLNLRYRDRASRRQMA